jgi:hypothetical protein
MKAIWLISPQPRRVWILLVKPGTSGGDLYSGDASPGGTNGGRAAQGEFRGHHLDAGDGGGNFGLDHQAQPAGYGGFDDEGLPGPGGTKYFNSPERGQLEPRRGASYALVRSIPSPEFQLCLSVSLDTEWQQVLTRDENLSPGRTVEDTLNYLRYLAGQSHLQEIHFLWRPYQNSSESSPGLYSGFGINF